MHLECKQLRFFKYFFAECNFPLEEKNIDYYIYSFSSSQKTKEINPIITKLLRCISNSFNPSISISSYKKIQGKRSSNILECVGDGKRPRKGKESPQTTPKFPSGNISFKPLESPSRPSPFLETPIPIIIPSTFNPNTNRDSMATQNPQNGYSFPRSISIREATATIPSRFHSESLRKTIQQLQQNCDEWFNDEVINAYFYLLSQRFPSVGILSSYCLVHPNGVHWSNSKEVMKKFREGIIDKILMPYHLPGHWTLLVITSKGEYAILDSLGRAFHEGYQLKNWLMSNFPQIKDWHPYVPFTNPHQFDTFNCGPYVCLYAELFAQGKSFDQINFGVSSIDVSVIRKQILQELQSNLDALQQLKSNYVQITPHQIVSVGKK